MNGIPEKQTSESVQNASQHIGIDQKKCIKCKSIKSINEFHKSPNTADRLVNKCKKCVKDYGRERYAANPEKVKETNRKWVAANPEKAKDRILQWRAANPKKVKKYSRKYYAANLEKARKANNKWQKENPEKMAAITRNRKAREKNAVGAHTAEDIQKILNQQGGLCNACGKKLIRYRKKQYHVDHIVPLAKGGTNWPDNIQLLCPTCNLSKHARDPVEWARENGRLF